MQRINPPVPMDTIVERLEFDDGGFYIGQWFRGCAHGFGVSIGPNSVGEYSGKWDSGYETCGVYVSGNGDYYAGSWSEGKRSGHGRQTRGRWIYQGEFHNGSCGPHGVKYASHGVTFYEGSWEDNRFHGFGVESCIDGSVYAGSWSKGLRHGLGVRRSILNKFDTLELNSCLLERTNPPRRSRLSISSNILRKLHKQNSTFDVTSPNKWRLEERNSTDISPSLSSRSIDDVTSHTSDHSVHNEENIKELVEVYAGEWVNDKRSGFGICDMTNGIRYVGSWLDNRKHGFGVLYHRLGKKEEGRFEQDRLIVRIDRRNIFQRKLKEATMEAVCKATQAAQRARERYARIGHEKAKLARIAAKTAEAVISEAQRCSEEAYELVKDADGSLAHTTDSSADVDKCKPMTFMSRPSRISKFSADFCANVIQPQDEQIPSKVARPRAASISRESRIHRLKQTSPNTTIPISTAGIHEEGTFQTQPSPRENSIDCVKNNETVSNPSESDIAKPTYLQSERQFLSENVSLGNNIPITSCQTNIVANPKGDASFTVTESVTKEFLSNQQRKEKHPRLERNLTLDNSMLESSLSFLEAERPSRQRNVVQPLSTTPEPSTLHRNPKLKSMKGMRAESVDSTFTSMSTKSGGYQEESPSLSAKISDIRREQQTSNQLECYEDNSLGSVAKKMKCGEDLTISRPLPARHISKRSLSTPKSSLFEYDATGEQIHFNSYDQTTSSDNRRYGQGNLIGIETAATSPLPFKKDTKRLEPCSTPECFSSKQANRPRITERILPVHRMGLPNSHWRRGYTSPYQNSPTSFSEPNGIRHTNNSESACRHLRLCNRCLHQYEPFGSEDEYSPVQFRMPSLVHKGRWGPPHIVGSKVNTSSSQPGVNSPSGLPHHERNISYRHQIAQAHISESVMADDLENVTPSSEDSNIVISRFECVSHPRYRQPTFVKQMNSVSSTADKLVEPNSISRISQQPFLTQPCVSADVQFPEGTSLASDHMPMIDRSARTIDMQELRRDSNLSTSSGTVVGNVCSMELNRKDDVPSRNQAENLMGIASDKPIETGHWITRFAMNRLTPNEFNLSFVLLNIIIILLVVIIFELHYNTSR